MSEVYLLFSWIGVGSNFSPSIVCQVASAACVHVDLDGSDSEVDWGEDTVEVEVPDTPPSATADTPPSATADIPHSSTVEQILDTVELRSSPSGGDGVTIDTSGEVPRRRRGTRGGWRKQRQKERRARSGTSGGSSAEMSTPTRSRLVVDPCTAEKEVRGLKRNLYQVSPITPERRARRWDRDQVPWLRTAGA